MVSPENPVTNALALALFAPAFVLIGVYFFYLRRLFSALERDQPAIYESLGRPSLFLRNSPQSSSRVVRAIWTRKFEPLGGEIAANAIKARRVFIGCGVYYVFMAAVIVWVVRAAAR